MTVQRRDRDDGRKLARRNCSPALGDGGPATVRGAAQTYPGHSYYASAVLSGLRELCGEQQLPSQFAVAVTDSR